MESIRLLKQHRPPWPESRICTCHGSSRWITTDRGGCRLSPIDCLNNTGLLGQGVEYVHVMGVEEGLQLINVNGGGVQ